MNPAERLPEQTGGTRSRLRFRPGVEILESRLVPSDVVIASFPSALFSTAGYNGNSQATGTMAEATSRASGDSSGATTAAGAVSHAQGAGSGVQVVTQHIVTIHCPQGPTGNESGPPSQFVTASAVAGEAPAAETPTGAVQAVSLTVAPAHSTKGMSAVPSVPDGPKIAEATVFIKGTALGPVGVPAGGNVSSAAEHQVAGSYPPSPSAAPVAPLDVASVAAAASVEATAPHMTSPPASVQVGFTNTLSGPIALSSAIEQLVPGPGDSTSGGEKDAGTSATAAAQRKALALGLRYLNPDMTDDEIAQAAGVSRRTLFRWQEYMSIKKALRQLYKRPRGFKDREGNIEGWFEEDE